MSSFLASFHFLRPMFLTLLGPLVIFVGYLFYKRHHKLRLPSKVVAPHLLSKMIDKPAKGQGYGPIVAISFILLIVIGVLAKPVWRMTDLSPSDNPPLYVVMDESLSMNKIDVAPNRNLKAQLLVKHLVKSGINRPIAVLGVAGSSHILLPPTDDQDLLALYLSYLDPSVMPKDGGDLSTLVSRLKNTQGLKLDRSSLLLVTDGVSSGQHDLTNFIQQHHMAAAVLYMNELGKQSAKALGVPSFDGATMNINDSALQQYFLSNQANSASDSQWQDESHWLIVAVAIIAGFWFRKGWTLQWALCLLLMTTYSQPSQAGAMDWLLTRDQQGMALMYMGKYQKAEQYFQDPSWKAVACYYQEKFTCAQKEFSKTGDSTAIFNMANSAAQDGRYKTAQQLYLALLEIQPENTKVKHNLHIIDEILQKMKRLSEKQHDQHPPSKDAVPPPKDANEISDGAKRKSYGQIPHSTLKATDVLVSDAATDKWLRDISRDPKDFVRRKFLSEYNQETK
ncbi:transporter [Vibrio inusitatus NBRC 102082]|uniref:Transporter n=1 Tax=Vibrio inusitatus NBRC 102082 TaxID=1219070 RepID=A0A4Y3HYJ5_9VIBR|nr:VWA domain-containing protein [Vibrio inusitatus]GEA52249.1 transporter [Vibrio inusitatus NBRC 102082]